MKFTAARNSSADRNSIIATSIGLSRAYKRRNLQDINSCFISITYYQDDAFTSRYTVYSTKRKNSKFGFKNEEKRKKKKTVNDSSSREWENSFINNRNWCSSLGLAINTFWACVGWFSRCFFSLDDFYVLMLSRVRLACICHWQMDSGHRSNGWRKKAEKHFSSRKFIRKVESERATLNLMQSKFTP